MTAEEYKRTMLEHAEECAKLGAKFRRDFRSDALIPIAGSITCSVLAVLTPFPSNLLIAAMAAGLLILVKVSVSEGEASFQWWMKLRQEYLDDMNRNLNQ